MSLPGRPQGELRSAQHEGSPASHVDTRALKALRELISNLRLSAGGGNRRGGTSAHDGDFRTLMARGWHRFGGPILLLRSSDDYTAREFLEGASTHAVWQGAFVKAGLSKRDLAQADHTFSNRSERLPCKRQSSTGYSQAVRQLESGRRQGALK